ncbi:MAG: Zn-ribbon domain-containing OB-fold protein [Dehalococcoidia bacterium]
MSDEYNLPLPNITNEAKPFWDGLNEDKLLIPKCNQCAHLFMYPKAYCPKNGCFSNDLSWEHVSGKGNVYSYTVVHRSADVRFQEIASQEPYVFALIELDEGPKLISNLINVDIENIVIGTPVQIIFEKINDEITLPKFAPILD